LVESNCGSLNLEESIPVERHESVTVKYYPFPIEGEEYAAEFHLPIVETFTSGTIQHEIEHNNGILITDKTS